MVRAVHDLHDEHDLVIDRVGIGAPGPVDPANGVVHDAPNLAGFADAVPLAALVEAGLVGRGHTGVEVRVDNDVNVAARGEWQHGAGRGHDDLLAVWWGTGIGGGLVLNGAVRTGPTGTAAEIGHTTYVPEGVVCGCGRQGHVEAYAGHAAMEAEARRRHAGGTPNELVALAGDDRMRSKIFAEALDADDPTAHELLRRAVEALGVGIASAVTLLDVDLVVIGGGLGSRLGEASADRIQQAVRRGVYAHPEVEVVGAELGDDAGVIGAGGLFAASAPGEQRRSCQTPRRRRRSSPVGVTPASDRARPGRSSTSCTTLT